MIIEALCNIIRNAVEAMHQGGRLSITAEKISEDGILIRITDTGCGIPEDKRPKVCKLGFSMKKEGKGIGLWFSNTVVEQHAGTISFMSEKDQGTTFSVFLPFQIPGHESEIDAVVRGM
jgi:signal transduction histidine kinase